MNEEFKKCNNSEEVVDHGGPAAQGVRVVFLQKMPRHKLRAVVERLVEALNIDCSIYQEPIGPYAGLDIILINLHKKDRNSIVQKIVDNRIKLPYKILSQEEYEKITQSKFFQVEFAAPFCVREIIAESLLSRGAGYEIGSQLNPQNDRVHSILIGTNDPDKAKRIIRSMADDVSELVEINPPGP